MSDTKNTKKLLIFNMDENKATLIRTLCVNLNVRLVKVYSPQYGESIGALAGIPAYPLTNQPYRGEDFSQEMMVICGFRPDELDVFLKAYRESGMAQSDGNAAQYELERGTALQRAFRRT